MELGESCSDQLNTEFHLISCLQLLCVFCHHSLLSYSKSSPVGFRQFVAVCRGLGLRTRYVACLDPLPPHPVSGGTSKRRTGRNSTGSSVTIDLTSEERHRTRRRRGGGDGGGPGGRTGLGVRSRAWAEVLCCEGESGDLVRGRVSFDVLILAIMS